MLKNISNELNGCLGGIITASSINLTIQLFCFPRKICSVFVVVVFDSISSHHRHVAMNYIKNSLFLFYVSSHIWTGTQATILNLRRMYDCCSTGNHFLFRSMQKQIIFNLSACLNTIFVVCLYFSFHCVFTIISWIEQTKKHRIDLRCTINVLINWPADRVFIDDTKWVCVCVQNTKSMTENTI